MEFNEQLTRKMKHLGQNMVDHTRYITLYLQSPENPNVAYVVEYDKLPESMRADLLTMVYSPSIQDNPCNDLGELLTQATFRDYPSAPMLNTLYGMGFIKEVAIDDIMLTLTPNARDHHPMREVVDAINKQYEDGKMVKAIKVTAIEQLKIKFAKDQNKRVVEGRAEEQIAELRAKVSELTGKLAEVSELKNLILALKSEIQVLKRTEFTYVDKQGYPCEEPVAEDRDITIPEGVMREMPIDEETSQN